MYRHGLPLCHVTCLLPNMQLCTITCVYNTHIIEECENMVVAENMCTDKHVQEHVECPLMCHVTCLLTQHAMSTICNVLAYTQCHRKILRIEIQTQTEILTSINSYPTGIGPAVLHGHLDGQCLPYTTL